MGSFSGVLYLPPMERQTYFERCLAADAWQRARRQQDRAGAEV